MFMMDSEKAEEPEIKLLTSVGSYNNKRIIENLILLLLDYAKAFDYVDHNKLWKILKEMGIPDHLTHLLRNLYAVRKQQLEQLEAIDSFQIGKGVHQGCILLPCLFNLYAEYIM